MKSIDPAWRENWKREIEGVFLYKSLAEASRTPELSKAFLQMAEQEEQHAAVWELHIREFEKDIHTPRPDLRIRLVAWIGRWFGTEAVLGFLLNDEVSDIASYTDQARRLGYEDQATYQQVLKDETSHA